MAGYRPTAYAIKQFGLRGGLRDALARMNLSQNEFARKCGISSGYMSQLLGGTRFAGPAIRARMCGVLHLDFDDLFEEVRHDD
jgi:transcriptional regulator with XRE-family HTH domain